MEASQQTLASQLTIRTAVDADLPQLVALLADDVLGQGREKLSDPLPPSYVAAFDAIRADPNNEIVVACIGGKIVACLQLTYTPSLSFQGSMRATVESVRTASELRGRGIGAALMRNAIERARAQGCAIVQLSTNRTRADAKRFYERLGFTATHEGMKLMLGQPQPPISTPVTMPKLYDDLASWWPLLSAPEDYAEEAAFYWHALASACDAQPRTLLELGSGGGNNAWHLKANAQLTLVDLAPGMLEVSRRLNPECEHIQGDMRDVRLGRSFDAVFVHDAICYMTSAADLRRVFDTAFAHCRPGGAALFAPDYVRETFREGGSTGGHDDGRRGVRYLEWTWDPDPADSSYTVDYAYLLRADDGTIRVEHDRHIEGLFAREDWLALLGEAGFDAACVAFEHSELPGQELPVFVARRR
jgi:ribosomal protein S18 acetylase RimI-like enzyme